MPVYDREGLVTETLWVGAPTEKMVDSGFVGTYTQAVAYARENIDWGHLEVRRVVKGRNAGDGQLGKEHDG